MPQNDEIQLSNDSDAMYGGWMHYLYYVYVFCATCLLTDTVNIGFVRIKPAISPKLTVEDRANFYYPPRPI